MKILCFYRYLRYYNKDERLHAGFIKKISEHSEIELKTFGIYMEDIYPELNLMPFRYGLCLEDLLKKFKPDVLLFHNKSRMFWDYNPTQSFKGNEWLPSGWHRFDIPAVFLEEDYFREENDDWYFDGNIGIILQRHYSQSLRKGKVKKIFFPFSVDTKIFKPNSNIIRKNKICFVGRMGGEECIHRRKAVEILKKYNLIDVYANGEKIGNNYVKCLQEYVCHLNGTLKFNISPAKIFEIIASGSVLLNNKADNGLEQLFDGGYVSYKNEDDLKEKVNRIIYDKNFVKTVSEKGMQEIKNKHTHEIRIQQLVDILKQEFNL